MTTEGNLLRFTTGLLIVLAAAPPVRAEGRDPAPSTAPPLLVMLDGDRRDALAGALAVELASREVELMVVDPPRGETPLARAAAAQYACRFASAPAAVFIERSAEGAATVRVVGADGDTIRHAPLPRPIEQVEPRVFAVVAHSLLEELYGPPEMPIRVTVSIDAPGRDVRLHRLVQGDGAEAEMQVLEPEPPPASRELTPPPAPPAAPAPPATPLPEAPLVAYRDGGDALDDDTPLLPRSGFFAEADLLFAGVALGGGVGLGWQLSEPLRLGVGLAAVAVVDGSAAYMPQLTFTRIGSGRSGRFDFGAQAGLVMVETAAVVSCGDLGGCVAYDVMQVGWAAGGFVGWTWELDDWLGLGVRLSAQIASIEASGPVVIPMVTVHSELPI